MTRQRSTTIRLRMPRVFARLRTDENGATAVEFALVALPFFGLLFAIMQTSLVMFAGQVLQAVVADVSRRIMTGQLVNKTKADFKAALCQSPNMFMFDCEKLLVQVLSTANFSGADPTEFEPDCFDPAKAADAACYNPGTASQVVVVRVVYEWPFGITILDDKKMLVAVSAFRNEPF